MPVGIFNQDNSPIESMLGDFDSILAMQVNTSAPAPSGASTITSPVLPDVALRIRLRHFPENLYDLRSESHLFRFMNALMGEAGAGGLRMRYMVAQFQNAMQSTHFYDLDRFYGAIFGATRNVNELLWGDPYSDLYPPNEQDQIADRDASFRDRIFRLASAINLGATLPGISRAAEAITQVDCDVFETWALIDTYGDASLGRTWEQIEAFGTWQQIEDLDPTPFAPTWSELSAAVQIGRTGTNSRSEVVVVPKKDYTRIAAEFGPDEAKRQRAEDEHSLVRVLSVLKPAGVLLTVDTEGLAFHREVRMADLQADSNYWEVVTKVVPRPSLVTPDGDPYPRPILMSVEELLRARGKRVIPKPPLRTQQFAEWSHNPEMVSVRSYSFRTGEDDDYSSPGDGPVVDGTNYDTVTYSDGTKERFTALRGVLDPRRALAARYASQGILVSHPYSGDRQKAVDVGA